VEFERDDREGSLDALGVELNAIFDTSDIGEPGQLVARAADVGVRFEVLAGFPGSANSTLSISPSNGASPASTTNDKPLDETLRTCACVESPVVSIGLKRMSSAHWA